MNPVTKFVARIICIALLLVPLIAAAQRPYPVITPDNAAQIVQIARYGNGVPRMLTFSADGTRLAVATTLGAWLIEANPDAGGACLAPTDNATRACRLLEGQGGAESITFSPDGAQIAGGGDDGSVMIWNAESGAVVARLENHIYPVSAVAWSENLIASGDESGIVRLWNTETWREALVLPSEGVIRQLRFDNGMIVAQTDEQIVRWNSASGALISQDEANSDLGNPLHVQVSERRADYSPDTGQIEIWDKSVLIATLNEFYGELGDVFFTDDSRVGGREISPVHLWSFESNRLTNDPPPRVIGPYGTRGATFGNDGVIHLFDGVTGYQITPLHGHIRAVNAVAFNPEGDILASASNDGTIRLWDAYTFEDKGALAVLLGHNSGVTDVAFNANGQFLASSGYDGTIRMWGMKP